jgi:uncharacterized membrane protein YeaQ/YmgE (transglycosylase-associated protein family)
MEEHEIGWIAAIIIGGIAGWLAEQSAKLNDVDPQAWLTDVLGQIADIPQGRLAELLPWNWKQPNLRAAA